MRLSNDETSTRSSAMWTSSRAMREARIHVEPTSDATIVATAATGELGGHVPPASS
jgi:hypothetical protein